MNVLGENISFILLSDGFSSRAFFNALTDSVDGGPGVAKHVEEGKDGVNGQKKTDHMVRLVAYILSDL